MPKLLYVTPYFPPQSRVGAMRPLRFVRHLREFGWEPVVLCDYWRGAEVGKGNLVPSGIEVVYDYSYRAREIHKGTPRKRRDTRNRTSPGDALLQRLPRTLANPELVPLGEHSQHIWHAVRAGSELCRKHSFEAILVNADPWAALLVGKILSQKFSIPFVADFRDPWGPCELRRPMRPLPIRHLVDRLERSVVERASCVVLNTETARRAYHQQYPSLPRSHFAVIRNSSDPALISEDSHDLPGEAFTMLFLGTLRPAVDGDALLAVLEELKRRGVGPGLLRLVVTAGLPETVLASARVRGVEAYLERGEHVSYSALYSAMESADLLVLQGHETDQRIPAKLYDYLMAERPILAMACNRELADILRDTGAGQSFALDNAEQAADFVMSQLAQGKRPIAPRHSLERYTARGATSQLADILTSVSRLQGADSTGSLGED